MTVILITSKDAEKRRILWELAVKKAEKYGSFICCGDTDSEIRTAFDSCKERPVILYPVNIVCGADLNKLAERCGQGYDMAAFYQEDGKGCIAALNRLPRYSVTCGELYSSASEANFCIANVPCDGYITEVTDSESYHKLLADILSGRFISDITADRRLFRPPFPKAAGFKGEYPMYIGRNCHFGENVTVTGGSCIGDNVYIGNNVKISSSVITEGAYIPDNSIIENTVTGYFVPAARHKLGTDGSTAGYVSLPSAFAAGQALSEKRAAYAYNTSEEAAAQAFAAGYVYSGGNIDSMGAVPENIFRYGLNRGDYECGVYFGSGYVRIWGGDGFPSDESLRRVFENALNSGKVKPSESRSGSVNKAEIYNMYNSELSKLISPEAKGIFADITVPDKGLYRFCRGLVQAHHLHVRDDPRIAFHISGDGSRISAYTDETGYVFHDKLVMLCLYYGNSRRAAVYSFFPHIDIKNEHGEKITLDRFLYTPDSEEMTSEELSADRKARENADIFLFDGAAIMARVLSILGERGITLSEAIAPLPVYSSANRTISSVKKAAALLERVGLPASGGKADISGHKAYFRPLRTGGVILSAESGTLEAASEICDFFEDILKTNE